jgi:hypothetical protein
MWMASSKLIRQIEPQIILDKKTSSIFIKGLEIQDFELHEIISDQKETARPEFVRRALKVGAIALRDIVVTEKTDYIKKEFQRLCVELDDIFQLKLGKEGMKGELNKIFGKNGRLECRLEDLFGDNGRLARDILDMNNRNSPIGQLRETIESYFVGKDSEMYSMLDLGKKDSPMSRIRQDIMGELEKIERMIEEHLAKKEIIEKTTKKGFEFEDAIEDFLVIISRPFNDLVERVGKKKGKLGNLTGDFVMTINDPTIKGYPPKIVIEAKAGENIRLTKKGLLGELDDAIKNREAKFAIAVTRSLTSKSIGCYREIEQDKIICAYEDNGLPLEVAYKVARTRLLLSTYKEFEKEIDVARINGVIDKISNDLNATQGIKAKLTGIGRTSEAITTDIKSLETNIRDSLIELQAILHGGVPAHID